jgi:NADH-quinone oxidoreductase subunit H
MLFQWIRATLPRLRADQLMRFAWLYLIPLTLFNIVLTGGLLLIPVSIPLRLGFVAASNWLLTILMISTLRKVTGVTSFGKVPRWVRARARATAPGAPPTAVPQPSGRELAGTRR